MSALSSVICPTTSSSYRSAPGTTRWTARRDPAPVTPPSGFGSRTGTGSMLRSCIRLSYGGFIRLFATKDEEAYKSIVRAYNTYLAEEYCSVAPDRLIGNAMVLETGVDDAIEEMRRCKEMGLRSATLRLWPNGGDRYQPEDDRFFAASLDMDMKLSPHVNFGGPVTIPPDRNRVRPRMLFGMGAGPGAAMSTIGDLIYHGVFDRFPDLRFYFAETQAAGYPTV